jgi:diguanylate cyclase (GGDEF)-like protein
VWRAPAVRVASVALLRDEAEAVGDQLIQAVATALARQTRATDLIARWGGEEFIAVLRGSRAGAQLFSGRVLAAVRALEVGKVGRLTISAGIAESFGEGGAGGGGGGGVEEMEEVVARADAKLYEAKSAGRDRVAE